MTGPITRRDALLRTAALASASMIAAAPSTGIAASLNKPARVEKIDKALQATVSAREIPGVVAMAANEQSVVYEGAFGFRDMAAASRMSTDTIPRRLDGQTADVGRRAATRGARQAGAGRAVCVPTT
jgi:methyl acetate hydrolase